jgi:hypothetical protein
MRASRFLTFHPTTRFVAGVRQAIVRSSLLVGAGVCSFLIYFAAAVHAGECAPEHDGTFDLIQSAIFEKHGCASDLCHGAAAEGGLDLRRGSAYDELVDRPIASLPVELYPGLRRVTPSNKGNSLLWLNLAAATLPGEWRAPLRAMPLNLPPLSFDELEVVRLWIENGAPREGTVPGTGALLDACLPPAGPLAAPPLPAPEPETGVQIRAPRQMLPPETEREVCFVSYYDLSGRVPAEFLAPDGDTFRYKRIEARQDPLSHHAVVIVYEGGATIDDPRWGEFACRGGERDGEACEPTDLDSCGRDGLCASQPMPAVACNGYGPGDAGIGTGETSLFSTMASSLDAVEGVYAELPLRGILVWNSHAFNLATQEAKLDIWINLEFAAADEQIHRLQRFVDVSAIFKMNAPPFGADEVCQHYVVPRSARLLDLSSHTHKRGRRFRVFEGKFACDGGPNHGAPCEPFGPDPGYPVGDLCAGAPCTSLQPPRAGDCNGDLKVTVDEIIGGVSIALGELLVTQCPRFDGDDSGSVSVDEIVAAVSAALTPQLRDPEESFLYVTYTYADPLVLQFHPPLELGGASSVAAERTLTYCALYDNGYLDPVEVKRSSTSPDNGFVCVPTHCAEGRIGARCGAGPQANRDRSCDSSPGTGDGRCDACPVGFGVTTDDEMFVLTGSYVGL